MNIEDFLEARFAEDVPQTPVPPASIDQSAEYLCPACGRMGKVMGEYGKMDEVATIVHTGVGAGVHELRGEQLSELWRRSLPAADRRKQLEVDAKRKIAANAHRMWSGSVHAEVTETGYEILRHLTLPYRTHRDFDAQWLEEFPPRGQYGPTADYGEG